MDNGCLAAPFPQDNNRPAARQTAWLPHSFRRDDRCPLQDSRLASSFPSIPLPQSWQLCLPAFCVDPRQGHADLVKTALGERLRPCKRLKIRKMSCKHAAGHQGQLSSCNPS